VILLVAQCYRSVLINDPDPAKSMELGRPIKLLLRNLSDENLNFCTRLCYILRQFRVTQATSKAYQILVRKLSDLLVALIPDENLGEHLLSHSLLLH
jgi:hypothetical protein